MDLKPLSFVARLIAESKMKAQKHAMEASQLDIIPEKSFDDGSISGLRKHEEILDLDQTVEAKVDQQIIT